MIHHLFRRHKGLGICNGILRRLPLFAKKPNVDELETVPERYYVLIAGHDAKYTRDTSSDRGDAHQRDHPFLRRRILFPPTVDRKRAHEFVIEANGQPDSLQWVRYIYELPQQTGLRTISLDLVISRIQQAE